MIVALCLNAMIAAAICWLTYQLWRWRQCLISLNRSLEQASEQSSLASLCLLPSTASYHLMLKRAQIANIRLGVAHIQMRSHQLVQIVKLIQMLQTIFLYRKHRYSRNKR